MSVEEIFGSMIIYSWQVSYGNKVMSIMVQFNIEVFFSDLNRLVILLFCFLVSR